MKCRSIARSRAGGLGSGTPVGRLVTRAAVGVSSSVTLAEAARLMRIESVSALVVDGGAAIVTERDISRGIGAGGDPEERVATVASPHPVAVDGSLSVFECGELMVDQRIRHVLVTTPERFPAVVSLRDIVEVLLNDAHATHQDPGKPPSENWLG